MIMANMELLPVIVRITPSIQKLHASTLDWTSSSQVPHRSSETLTTDVSLTMDVAVLDAPASVVNCNQRSIFQNLF